MSTLPDICILMSYYEESPDWLRATIKSWLKVGAKKLVAVDGAYKTFPDAKATSPEGAHKAIVRACNEFGIELHHHVPSEPFESEIHKRDFMFRLGEQHTTEDDWFLVMDADERITTIDGELRLLGDVAYAILHESDGSQQPIRCFFRAQRGIEVKHNHFTYVCGDQVLWSGPNPLPEEFAYDSRVNIQHLADKRPVKRLAQKLDYYADRDRNRREALACYWCGTYSSGRVPALFAAKDGKPHGYVVGCCPECEPAALEEGRKQFAEMVGSDNVSLDFS